MFNAEKVCFADAEPLQEDPALEESYCQAVLCRIRFRKVLFNAPSDPCSVSFLLIGGVASS